MNTTEFEVQDIAHEQINDFFKDNQVEYSYSFHLFSQLALNKYNDLAEMEYDLQFNKLIELHKKFLNSPYNVDKMSEYDCIKAFLEYEHKKQ